MPPSTKGNRPFSVQNVVDALQKQGVKKTAVERALASLVEQGAVNKKEYGKAKIFLLAQERLDLPDASDLEQLESDLRSLSEQLAATKERVAALRTTASSLRAQPTLREARARADAAKEKLEEQRSKRERLGDGSSLISRDEKLALDKAYYDKRALWKKYRGIVKGVVEQVAEASGRKPAELKEEMGYEADEDVDVAFADFPDIANPMKTKRGAQPQNRIAKRLRQT